MAHFGRVFNKNGQFIAKIYTRESDTRFAMEGPRRDDEQQAAQDLSIIRAAADGEATRTGGLKAMQLAAKRLQDAVKAIPLEALRKSMVASSLRSTPTSRAHGSGLKAPFETTNNRLIKT